MEMPPKSKPHGMLESSKPRPNTSPEVSKHKLQRHPEAPIHNSVQPSPSPVRGSCKREPSPSPSPRSSFKPVPARSEHTKSPLIIDKNEHFTIYRDPTLVRPESEPSATAAANHVAYLHPHLHPLHGSSHATCLTPSSHHPSHLLPPSSMTPHAAPPPSHHSVHHPHLLTGMLPSSILGSHTRVDSGGLGQHLAMAAAAAAHHHPHQQQQFLHPPPPHQGPGGAPYNLYPIIWPYPNGNPHSYPPGLGLPVNSDSNLRRVSLQSISVMQMWKLRITFKQPGLYHR